MGSLWARAAATASLMCAMVFVSVKLSATSCIELTLRVEEVVRRIYEDHGGVAERHGDVNERTKGPGTLHLIPIAWD